MKNCSYTFTNGTKVSDWIETLPADSRELAMQCVEEFVAQRRPLNMLQVKIRMTEPRNDIPPEIADEIEPYNNPPRQTYRPEPEPERDFYNTQQPPRPSFTQVETPAQPREITIYKKIIIGVSALLLFVMFATNPSDTEHRQEVATRIATAATRCVDDLMGNSGMSAGVLGSIFDNTFDDMFSRAIVENVVNSSLISGIDYKDYGFFSLSRTVIDGEQHTVSFGILGKVYPVNSDLIDKSVADQVTASVSLSF